MDKEREAFEDWIKNEDPIVGNDAAPDCIWAKKYMWKAWQAKAQEVSDKYTPIVLALEDVQSKIAKTSFLTMDEENEKEIMAVDANELAAYIDELVKAQEPTND